MRSCFRQTLFLLLGAAAVLLMTFLLLYTGRLALVPGSVHAAVFYAVSAVLPGLGLPLLAAALLRPHQAPGLGDAWQCCGVLSAVGAGGAVLTTLATMLLLSRELWLYLGISLLAGFLFLYLGGLVCFLHRYLIPCRCC